MHILLTNDDGPPSPDASPYLSTFMRILTSPPHNHTVSVVIPTIQRSWIGKAHLLPPSAFPPIKGAADNTPSTDQQAPTSHANEQVSELVTPRYYSPTTGAVSSTPPSSLSEDAWVLVPGTPSTCIQLGVFHLDALFPARAPLPPIDLVVSGPNYGRNTTAAFALSSGTLGGALEAAVCGLRAVALSFAFYTRQEGEDLIAEASGLGVRIIEKLVRDWGVQHDGIGEGDRPWAKKGRMPDVFNVNIPLKEGIGEAPVKWTWMLDNKWSEGSLYKVVGQEEAEKEGAGKGKGKDGSQLSFKWSPTFTDVWKTIEDSHQGNDGLLMKEKMSSVTPLVANYESLFGVGKYEGDFKL